MSFKELPASVFEDLSDDEQEERHDPRDPRYEEERKQKQVETTDKVLEDFNKKIPARLEHEEKKKKWAELRELIPEGFDPRLAAALKAFDLEGVAAKMVEHGYDDASFIEELAGSDRSLRELASDVGMSLSDARNVAYRLRVSVPVKAGAPSFKACLSCGAKEGIKACGRCKAVYFCNAECQKRAWPGHKVACQAAMPKMPKKPEPPPPEPAPAAAAGGPELEPVSAVPDTPAAGPDAPIAGSGIEFRVAGTWTLRAARMAEAPTMAVLDAFNWPKPLQCLSESEIRARITRHPDGQWVAVANGMIMATLYSQRIASVDVLTSGHATFRDAVSMHDEKGGVLQLLSVQTRKEGGGLGLGDLLVRHALQQGQETGLECAVAVTRCTNWHKEAGTPLLPYAMSGADPTVSFHTSRGAKVLQLIKGWRVDDEQNDGCGVLMRYELKDAEDYMPPSLYDPS